MTVTEPPPLSVLIGAEDCPDVSIVKFLATVTPPPVVMIPPEPLADVLIVTSSM